MSDLTRMLQETVTDAVAEKRPLQLIGGGTRSFYGRTPKGDPLQLAGHTGIINYQPKELVITARAGTLLSEIESVLAEQGQVLAFEPPRFGEGSTIGGVIASGLSGPARPFNGSTRDFVLGARVINGQGEILRFGGEVMKNVAGYDLSRLMCGALGTLGLLLDVSLKVMPRAVVERTQVRSCSEAEALALFRELAGKPLPITAACFTDGQLCLRLSGSRPAVLAAAQRVGGEELDQAAAFWVGVRDLQHPSLASDRPLWRISLPATATPIEGIESTGFIDWGGAQRWLSGRRDVTPLRDQAESLGGHATLFRGGDRDSEVFQPLQPTLLDFHQRLKRALDPVGIFNPGRLYPQL
ncbi:MAG: glycolate oxidase subunit GlcE [Sedimenticola sp.]|nr:MAG: glycolate oxidase subunit GlcE [Sedimenticola sp.]